MSLVKVGLRRKFKYKTESGINQRVLIISNDVALRLRENNLKAVIATNMLLYNA